MFALKGAPAATHSARLRHVQPLGTQTSVQPPRSVQGNQHQSIDREDGIDRRGVLRTTGVVVSIVGMALLDPKASYALGKSTKELAKAARERREKLKETARLVKEKGTAQDAFAASDYQVSEEAKTPNAVNRSKKD